MSNLTTINQHNTQTETPENETPHKAPRRGFSLIEIAVAVGIIGLLAAIAIPTFLGQRKRAQDTQAISALRNVAMEARALATNQEVEVFPGLDSEEFITAIAATEPAYQITGPHSTGPNHVVAHRVEPTLAEYAALSESGTCWYAFDFLREHNVGYEAGLYLYSDSSEDAQSNCGRLIDAAALAADPTPPCEQGRLHRRRSCSWA